MRHLRRQELERKRRLRLQIDRGRADPTWHRCNDGECIWFSCLYKDGHSILQDRDKCQGGIPVVDIMGDFATMMAEKIWPEANNMSAKQRRAAAVESFVASPPVRGAFLLFKTRCREQEHDPSEEKLTSELAAIRPLLEELVSGLGEATSRLTIHKFVSASRPQMETENWKLQDFAMQFLIAAESWRQYSAVRRAGWAFGGSDVVADVLMAVLLHLWLMHKEGCFAAESQVDEVRTDQIWDDWLDKYPLAAMGEDEHDEDAEEEDESEGNKDERCIEGRGRYVAPRIYPDTGR